MKAYTSRERFDERRRFTAVRERMGQIRLDADANEQALLVRTDARRRSGDVAEGSPDDGFRVTDTHLLDPVTALAGWDGQGLDAGDERVIPRELELARRDPDTLPHVVRSRGHVALRRTLPGPVDLLHLPTPLAPDGRTYQAAALILQLRVARPPTDDEVVDVTAIVVDAAEAEHEVASVTDLSPEWSQVRIPLSALDAAPRGVDDTGAATLPITGWGLTGLPPRAEVFVDALLVADDGLSDDVVLRGGDGTLAGAGRIYLSGLRTFLEHDWRYSLQPDLPDPPPLSAPDGSGRHLLYLDVWERPVHAFQDPFLGEPALAGEDTSFRSRKVTQVRARTVAPGASERLPTPTGDSRLTTNVPAGELPDRFPPEEADPCRDRCLFTENVSTGEGYLGHHNVHVRIEALSTDLARPVIGWSRDNAATVAPLREDAVAGADAVRIDPADAKSFLAGDLVVVEDERSRLDPDRASLRAELRRLLAVDTATGVLEFETAGAAVTDDPDTLEVGGPLARRFAVSDAAAVRRWDGADWALTGVRYNLADGITFALAGEDLRTGEYWSFTARVDSPDGAARGVVEQLTDEPVAGPRHVRTPLARVTYTAEGRAFTDLRRRFLPLHEVRDRLIELGRRRLAPGAFTVVVGDGERTFGDIDQDLAEGVTGDEALQAAVDRLGDAGGTVYVRAGDYRLEHPVLLRGVSNVRLLGDGDATRLTVTGAGGAFYLDGCGVDGSVRLELLDLVESPAEETPIGLDVLVGPPPTGGPAGLTAEPLVPDDLVSAVPQLPDLITQLGERIRDTGPFEGRAAGSVVATLARLRRLQRTNPGRPLEDIAGDELTVLRRLPHGVVTVADSRRVELRRLSIASRERGDAAGDIAAGVLVSGACRDVSVAECEVAAPSGVVATAYGRYLSPAALARRPRSGLFLDQVTVADNDLTATGASSYGIRVADGVLEGLTVAGNHVAGFRVGVAFEDQAEARTAEPVDRSVVRDNRVEGARSVGILVAGDGIDVDSNEVRVAAVAETVAAGVQVTGVANRVRGCWIGLPANAQPSPLAVTAGILVGSGVDADGASRPVHDVEIADNRVEGRGAPATGVLVGGAQPIFDVRIRDNAVRDLGDAGIRAWANVGAVGGLRIQDNRIEGVARTWPRWNPDTVAAAAALAPDVDLPATSSPRDVLDRLLQAAAGAHPALDAVLRFLEQATLRGGIVLSLTEESVVRDNHVMDVGSRIAPADAADLGAAVRIAGVVTNGGRDLVVDDNVVSRVHTPVTVTAVEPPAPEQARPPVFDFLRRLRVEAAPLGPPPADVHGSAVALRRAAMAYTVGDARERQRIGGYLYTSLEALADALEGEGSQTRRLGVQLSAAIAEMAEAQSAEDHTSTSNLARAVLSRAAAQTAREPAVTAAWSVAARFDSALLDEDEDVVAAATEVAETVDDLTQGLEQLDLSLTELAQAVIAGSGTAATRLAARLDLAAALGRMAEGRARKVAIDTAVAGRGLAATDRTMVEGLVRLSLDALTAEDPTGLNDDELARLERGAEALSETLQTAHPPLAERVRHEFSALRRAGGSPRDADVDRLRATLEQVRALAAGETTGLDVAAADLDAQQATFSAELVTLTAEQLDRRVAGLELDTEAAATRTLRLVHESAGQLVRLTSDQPDASRKASDARRAVSRAITDVDNRAAHTTEARRLLRELQEEQAELVGTGTGVEPTATVAEPATAGQARDTVAPRLSGLAQLLAETGDAADADVRREAAELFQHHVRSAVDVLDLSRAERTALVAAVPNAAATFASDERPEARAAAVHTLANVLERTGLAATRTLATREREATVHALTGALARVVDPDAEDAAAIAAASRFLETHRDALAASTVGMLSTATTALTARTALRDALAGLTHVRPLPRPVGGLEVQARTADGLYAAGVQERLRLHGNLVSEVRTGAAVHAADANPLSPQLDAPDVTLSIGGNQIVSAAFGGLDVRPGGVAAVDVSGNEVVATAGAGGDAGGPGGAVVAVVGTGNLVIAGNTLRDNGNRRVNGLLHELLLDWDGNVTVRDNLVRHAGAGAGGAGLVMLSGAVDDALVRRLATRPALEVDVPPARPRATEATQQAPVDELLTAGLADRRDVLTGGATFGVGALKLATREAAPSYELLEAGQIAAPAVTLAETGATRWLDGTPSLRFDPLAEFLGRVARPTILPFPLARRAVHVAGNDVVAAGPALLVVAGFGSLVSATVVGNELESSAPTGAVYLRDVDSTVLSSNRCECLREVNVAVVRARRSLVSVMGNVAAGAEPPVRPRPPFIPIRPDLSRVGDLHLAFKVGDDAAMTLKLDSAAMLKAIETRKDKAFREASTAAETEFANFAARRAVVVEEEVAEALAAGIARRAFRVATGERGPTLIVDHGALRGQPQPAADEEADAEEATVEEGEAPASARRAAAPGSVSAQPTADAVERAVATTNTILKNRTLSRSAKLYGIAVNSGLASHQARALVQRELVAAGGDEQAALTAGLEAVTGVRETEVPTVTEQIARTDLLENVLGLALRNRDLVPFEPILPRRPLPPPPPDPREHSLVVIGGSRVGALSNVTTAGVHVHNAAQSVENNL